MPRLSKPLTDIQVRNAKPKATPYKLADSRGLHLLVLPSGSKHWRFRYRLAGKENMFAIGAYPDISLALAREACDDARKLVSEGSLHSTSQLDAATEDKPPSRRCENGPVTWLTMPSAASYVSPACCSVAKRTCAYPCRRPWAPVL